jgi:hypothetical protein
MDDITLYLGRDYKQITSLSDYQMNRFSEVDQRIRDSKNTSLLDYLLIQHNTEGRSFRQLEQETGIPKKDLRIAFDYLGLPRLSRREATIRSNTSPEFREKVKVALASEEYKQKASKIAKKRFEDPTYRMHMGELSRKRWANPEYKERVSAQIQKGVKKSREDPEVLARISAGLKKHYEDPEAREEVSRRLKRAHLNHPEYAVEISRRMRELFNDPEYRARNSEMLQRVRDDPKVREMLKRAAKERGKDPDFVFRLSDLAKERWKNPIYRERVLNGIIKSRKDPEVLAKISAGLKKHYEDPEARERASLRTISKYEKDPTYATRIGKGVKKSWQDPERRRKGLEQLEKVHNDPEVREMLRRASLERWQDPEFVIMVRQRMHEAFTSTKRKIRGKISKKLWKNLEFREKVIFGNKKAKNTEEYKQKASERQKQLWRKKGYSEDLKASLHSYHGFRKDIGYHSRSMMEANLARVFIYCGRDIQPDCQISLNVPEEVRSALGVEEISSFVDFISIKRDNKVTFYEIVAEKYPYSEIKSLKLELMISQFPNADIRVIDSKKYSRIERIFRDKIDGDNRFVGWEDSSFNIKTDPAKFK